MVRSGATMSSRSLSSMLQRMAIEKSSFPNAHCPSQARCLTTSSIIRSPADNSAASPSSSSSESPSTSSSSSVSYPYSTHTRSPIIAPSRFTKPPPSTQSSRGVMDYVHHQLRSQFDENDRLTALFHRRSPTQIPIGSVVTVESWTSTQRTGSTSFSGILLGVRRRGTSTSFVLRNLVQKLGVEVRFNLYSPLLKDVKVVARADAGRGAKTIAPGSIRRARRAKLYYLRKDDNKIAGVAKAIKSRRQQDEKNKRQALSGASGPTDDTAI